MLLLPVLLLGAACSGGGGGAGAPGANPVRVQASGVAFAPGQDRATLDIRLEGPVGEAALLQFELRFDPARLGPASTGTVVEPQQAVPTADAEEVESGRLVVLCGDARNRLPRTLDEGPLLRLHLDARPPRSPGTGTLELRDFQLVDASGNELPVSTTPLQVPVTWN